MAANRTAPGASLDGQRVVVTRARRQAGELADAFRQAGAEVVFLPLLEVAAPEDPRPLEEAAAAVGSYDWLVFTSANAVEAFLPRLETTQPFGDATRVAVVGPATARAVRGHGVEPAVVASRADAEGLVATLGRGPLEGTRVLVPQADDARPVAVEGLRARGARVNAVVAYAKRCPPAAAGLARELFDGRELGWVTFTSPRIVRHFAALFGAAWEARQAELRAISIGAVTSAELRRQGVAEIAEAETPTPSEMVRAACRNLLREAGHQLDLDERTER